MSDVLGLIEDGYTESGVLLGVPGLYPRLAFRFRPMLIQERMEYGQAAEKAGPMTLRKLVASYLAKKLQSWDLKDAKGETVPLTTDNLLKLKARLFDRLFSVVSTDQPPDLEPDKAADDDGDVADVSKAAETGRTVAEVREERQRKNS